MESLLIEALGYAKLGLPVFPLSPLSKIPLKNTTGFKEATTNEELIFECFTEIEPFANVGISLVGTPYFVIDIDDHDGTQSGMKSIMGVSNGNPLPDNVTAIRTPNNGTHLYFKVPENIEIKQQIGFKPGLDCIKNFVVGPGSRVKRKDGTVGTYEVVNGSLDNIGEAPAWLISAIASNQKAKLLNGSYMLDYNNKGSTKRYTATFIEKVLNGASEGERNNFFSSIIGTLLNQGMDPKMAYDFTIHINDNFVNPKLSSKEVNDTFKSILKRELNKRKGVAT